MSHPAGASAVIPPTIRKSRRCGPRIRRAYSVKRALESSAMEFSRPDHWDLIEESLTALSSLRPRVLAGEGRAARVPDRALAARSARTGGSASRSPSSTAGQGMSLPRHGVRRRDGVPRGRRLDALAALHGDARLRRRDDPAPRLRRPEAEAPAGDRRRHDRLLHGAHRARRRQRHLRDRDDARRETATAPSS